MESRDLSESRVAGAMLGCLFPPLDLAADELYARVNAGERIDGGRVLSSLGFGTGVLDHVLVEAFKACVPAVKLFLAAGGLVLIGKWVRDGAHVAGEEERRRREKELELRIQEQREFRRSFAWLVESVRQSRAVHDRRDAEKTVIQVIVCMPERTNAIDDDNNDDDKDHDEDV